MRFFCTITSPLMPVVSGSCEIFSGSVPAMHAAALIVSPAAPPDVMNAPSTPRSPATNSPDFSSSRPMSTKPRLASSIFSRTKSGGPEPPTTVPVPTALIERGTPRNSYTPTLSKVPIAYASTEDSGPVTASTYRRSSCNTDQISARIQPMTVQPKNRFTRKMASQFRLRLSTAMMVGAK